MSRIRIVTEPSVHLIGRQDISQPELDRFLADHEVSSWDTDTDVCGEKLVEIAGRLCYMSFAKPRPGGNAAYIGHILDVGHGSVLEHAVFSLIITGVSRSLTHELVRHRVGISPSQLSQRYVDESDVAFVVPPALLDEIMAGQEWIENIGAGSATDASRLEIMHSPGREAGLVWLKAMEHAADAYAHLGRHLQCRENQRDYAAWEVGLPSDTISNGFRAWLEDQPAEAKTARRKAAREAARSVLPNCTETKIFITANARALRHFIELRANPGADAEIRRLALAVLKTLQAESPNLFGDYAITESGATTDHRKV